MLIDIASLRAAEIYSNCFTIASYRLRHSRGFSESLSVECVAVPAHFGAYGYVPIAQHHEASNTAIMLMRGHGCLGHLGSSESQMSNAVIVIGHDTTFDLSRLAQD